MTKTVRIEPSSETPAALLAKAQELVGRVVADRYRIDALLAARPSSAIYRAEHLKLSAWVALKVVRPDASGADFARVEREAVAGAQPRHPNLCAVTDAGELADGGRYLAMELVAGSTLRDVLRAAPLPAARSVRIARQLLAAVNALHAVGLVHAGVEPSNVILGGPSGDDVKLIDFGRARLDPRDSATSTADGSAPFEARRAALGSPPAVGASGYAPPESVRGDDLDARADLYSVGLILYEMLAGKRPFEADDDARPFAEQRGAIPRIEERTPGVTVPEPLQACIDRLLSTDKNGRYPTASAAMSALDQASPAMPADRAAAPSRSVAPAATAKRSVPPGRGPVLLDRAHAAAAASPADRALDLAHDAHSAFGHRLSALGATLARAGVPRWAVAASAAAVLMLGVVIWTLARGGPSRDPSATAAAAGSSSSPGAHVDSVHAAPGAASTPTATPVSIEVDGKDAAAWKKQLFAAIDSEDWSRAGKATVALVELDEPAFREAKVVGAVMSTAVALEAVGGPPADAVFEALRSKLGPRGLEILFEIVRSKGGTKGSKRAAAILDEPEVVARQPPPLRITIELLRARCEDKPALFRRAAEEGDDRALTSLRVLRETECPRRQKHGPCCFRDNEELAAAIKRLRERLGKPLPPVDD